MIHLFHNEWIKASHKISTWLMLALYIILTPVMYFIFQNFTVNIQGDDLKVAEAFLFNIESVWEITTFFSSYLVWLFVFIIVSITADDLRHNIWKQHVIEGLNRNQLITSKIVLILILAFFGSLITGIVAFITLLDSGVVFVMADLKVILDISARYFLYLTAIMILSLLVVILIKSSGLTIIMLLGWFWIAEPIIRWIDKSEFTQYLFANSFNDLITNPISKLMELPDFQLASEHAIIATVVWIGVILGLTFLKVNKSDL